MYLLLYIICKYIFFVNVKTNVLFPFFKLYYYFQSEIERFVLFPWIILNKLTLTIMSSCCDDFLKAKALEM